jgi:hypothetical protein
LPLFIAFRSGRQQPLPQNRGRDTDDPRHLAELGDLGGDVAQPLAELEHVDVRGRPHDAIAELPLQSGHEGQRDQHRDDADHDAEHRDEGNDGDEGLLPARQQIPDGDEQLERQPVHHAAIPSAASAGRG